jgi:phosphate transport system substrate-binding protein
MAGHPSIRFWRVTGLAILMVLVFAMACGRRKQHPTTIRVSGAWALYPLMQRWSDSYTHLHPEIRVEVCAGGAGKGITDCLSEQVDLAMVSRDLRPEELAQGAVPHIVARDAVFVVLSASHPAAAELGRTGLTRPVLAELFLGGSSARFPGLRVYTRSDACGAAETWAKFLGVGQEDLKGIAVYGDPGISEAVRQDGQAIGYNNLAFAFNPRTGRPAEGLLVVSLDANGNGRIDPEEDVSTQERAIAAIAQGHYPSPPSRNLLLVTKGSPRGASQDFLRWIQSEGQSIAREAGFIPAKP